MSVFHYVDESFEFVLILSALVRREISYAQILASFADDGV